MISSKVTQKRLKVVSPQCRICKGSCYHPSDNSKTQSEVRQQFGVLISDCITDEDGTHHCPAYLGLL